jgi:hypothetical protein
LKPLSRRWVLKHAPLPRPTVSAAASTTGTIPAPVQRPTWNCAWRWRRCRCRQGLNNYTWTAATRGASRSWRGTLTFVVWTTVALVQCFGCQLCRSVIRHALFDRLPR